MVQQRIALFGTSADPPTRGHQALLEQLLHRYDRVATWASDNPMKQHGAALSVRAMLLKALVEQLNSSNLDLAQDLNRGPASAQIGQCHRGERPTLAWSNRHVALAEPLISLFPMGDLSG